MDNPKDFYDIVFCKDATEEYSYLSSFCAAFKSLQRSHVNNVILVNSFIRIMIRKSQNNPTLNKFDTQLIEHCWEKIIHHNLYQLLFGQLEVENESSKICTILSTKLRAYSWISEPNLQISYCMEPDLVKKLVCKLITIKDSNCPSDKLKVLVDIWRDISSELCKYKDSETTADDIFPYLILFIMRSNSYLIFLHLRYIARYKCRNDYFKGLDEYVLTSMQAALSFIYDLSDDKLNIRPEDEKIRNIPTDIPEDPLIATYMDPNLEFKYRKNSGSLDSARNTKIDTWINSIFNKAVDITNRASKKINNLSSAIPTIVGIGDTSETDDSFGPP